MEASQVDDTVYRPIYVIFRKINFLYNKARAEVIGSEIRKPTMAYNIYEQTHC